MTAARPRPGRSGTATQTPIPPPPPRRCARERAQGVPVNAVQSTFIAGSGTTAPSQSDPAGWKRYRHAVGAEPWLDACAEGIPLERRIVGPTDRCSHPLVAGHRQTGRPCFHPNASRRHDHGICSTHGSANRVRQKASAHHHENRSMSSNRAPRGPRCTNAGPLIRLRSLNGTPDAAETGASANAVRIECAGCRGESRST